ncbi:hypothetical protein B0H21DRAFT_701552 [Amylocystis lapponica]|nr:hypothetical protein B0H21DRAFT_701552 [Amylocystis lapponica]
MSLDEIPVHDREGKPGQAIFKLTAANAVKEPAKKKPVMACLFCRERKIACGPPVPGHADQRCNQCARRELKCEYPKESRRGQHKRGPRAMRMQALTEAALAPHPPGASASASVPVPGSASGSAPPKVRAGKERGRSESSSQRAVNRVAQRKTAVLQKERAAGGGGIPASM